ncbi:MAG: DUF1501 domain-containing protein [Planctomycetes bacterium]|nr:DUF1501 domain-containing protein [Planctomycetota bacterium]
MHPANWFQTPLTRRHILHSTTAGGLATFMGMPIRGLLGRETEGGPRRPAQADAVILLWMGGGMSHLDTFDPKPGAATGGEFAAIRTAVDGITVSEILPTVASQLQHATIVRSLTGDSADHENATHHLLTSYPQVRELVHPSLGSIVANQVERLGDLPAFVTVGGEAPSPGYLGQMAEAYFIGEPGTPDPTIALPEGITQVRTQRRLEILEGLNGRFSSPAESLVDAVGGSYAAAVKLMRSPALAAFDITSEPASVREAYGDTRFGRGCLLARRLVEQGVRFVQVNLGGFDTHVNNFPPCAASALSSTRRSARCWGIWRRAACSTALSCSCSANSVVRPLSMAVPAATIIPTCSADSWPAAASRGASFSAAPIRRDERPWSDPCGLPICMRRSSTSSESIPTAESTRPWGGR